ncbi:hypothetical protein PRK78_003630 [Emydomyces testavorans]|uniref:Uncharacterized protein n=1 Tax=Emydomyces testavorans TaxID=2070801 RepID=A0AAF0DIG2_9EURO|nr:hypothetical protein PRK78_003630 [Emydomyces testavorans]
MAIVMLDDRECFTSKNELSLATASPLYGDISETYHYKVVEGQEGKERKRMKVIMVVRDVTSLAPS